MRVSEVRPVFVEYIPENLVAGTLYISERFRTCSHLCCCGCGEEVVTPLGAAEWSLTKNGRFVSLRPSIGNWDYGCRSHYWIRRNAVRWCLPMTVQQVALVKQRDSRDLRNHIDTHNSTLADRQSVALPWWKKVLRRLLC